MSNTDFNGDGRDDIVWRHTPSGLVTNWLGQPNGGFVSNPAAGLDKWAVGSLIAVGDFNGDGRSDTLWQTASGEVFSSLTWADGAFYFVWSLGFVARVGQDWHVSGTGDFNGDGRDDVLWRHDNGTVSTWLGNIGGGFAGKLTIGALPSDAAWHIAGTGDFNGDGRADVLWRNDNGTVTDWLGQADGSFVANPATASYAVAAVWHIEGTGDFNGDGRDDILWRHDDGTITDWLGQADGTFFGNFAAAAYRVDAAWHVAATGDYNGDGRDDILWRHDTGMVTDWLGQADTTFFGNFANANYAVDPAWQIQPNLSGAGMWDY